MSIDQFWGTFYCTDYIYGILETHGLWSEKELFMNFENG